MSETLDTRKPTTEEAEAILTLVRGGWLRLEPTAPPSFRDRP